MAKPLVLYPPLLPPVGFPQASTGFPPQAISDSQGPPAPFVVMCVPPAAVMKGSSSGENAGLQSLPLQPGGVYAPLSPLATNKFCPCTANSRKIGSSDLGSAGSQPNEQLSCLAMLSVAIRFRISTSLLPS